MKKIPGKNDRMIAFAILFFFAPLLSLAQPTVTLTSAIVQYKFANVSYSFTNQEMIQTQVSDTPANISYNLSSPQYTSANLVPSTGQANLVQAQVSYSPAIVSYSTISPQYFPATQVLNPNRSDLTYAQVSYGFANTSYTPASVRYSPANQSITSTQTASVANAFSPASVVNTAPKLPNTGGGGKALASQTSRQVASATPAKPQSFWSEMIASISSTLAFIF